MFADNGANTFDASLHDHSCCIDLARFHGDGDRRAFDLQRLHRLCAEDLW